MNPELQQAADRQMRTMQTICGGLMASLGVYVGVAWFLQRQGEFTPGAVPEHLPFILALVAVSMLLVGSFIFRALAAQARSRETPAKKLLAYQNAVVIAFALRESAGVIGLVATLLTGDLRWVVGLSVLAAAAMIAAWPRRAALESLLSEIQPIG